MLRPNNPAEPTLDPRHKFAVAVWCRDDHDETVYEIAQRDITDVSIAATVARAAAKAGAVKPRS